MSYCRLGPPINASEEGRFKLKREMIKEKCPMNTLENTILRRWESWHKDDKDQGTLECLIRRKAILSGTKGSKKILSVFV